LFARGVEELSITNRYAVRSGASYALDVVKNRLMIRAAHFPVKILFIFLPG
jgi:hypothetical protein